MPTFKTVVNQAVRTVRVTENLQTEAIANKRMNEVDEHGWAHIHQAAKKGYHKSVEKFIKAHDDQLEFETQDELKETPLLVAVRAGKANIDTISIIIELGGNVSAVNTLNHGVVEICCLENHTEVLQYLVSLKRPELPVWKKMLKFCTSELEDEAESAGRALSTLTIPIDDHINPNWRYVYSAGGVTTLIKVIKSAVGDKAKAQALLCLINILEQPEVKEQLVAAGGIEALIKHLRSPTNEITRLVSIALSMLCQVKMYADKASQQGVIQALVNVIRANEVPSVLMEVMNAVGVICDDSTNRQTLFNSTKDSISSVVSIMEDCSEPDLLLALCQSISKLCRRHVTNQNGFIDSSVSSSIIMLTDIRNKEIQLAAVDTIHMLVENNPYTQSMMAQEGAVYPLINLLHKSKNQVVQEKTAGALWALAGDNGEERRIMAATMGVDMLIDFLGSLSESLHFIGSEGLGVLAQGAQNKQDQIADANGVHPLVRLLKCDKEYLVLSAIRSIRHLCLSVGYLPHTANQNTVSQARGVKLLVALLTLSSSELIQVEAALTLASTALGNQAVMDEIWASAQHIEFSYIRVLKLLYSTDKTVQLLAGAALATFAYNNMSQQQLIAAEGGVRFSGFVSFLQSEDEYLRCNAAFQVVVLSRIIPDEEQAISSAAGIKLLADILNESQSPVIHALAADCVARLAHTRAGVPAALIEIGCVNRLCDLMSSDNSQVRGCSAIALAYLSFNHRGERQLLNRCRNDTFLIKCLKYYTTKHKLSTQFIKEWKHYRKIGGLPPIKDGRPSLVSQRGYKALRPVTNSRNKLNESRAGESQERTTPSGTNTPRNATVSSHPSRLSFTDEGHASGRSEKTSSNQSIAVE